MDHSTYAIYFIWTICNLFLFFIMGLFAGQDLVFSGCTGICYVSPCEPTRGWQCPCWKAFRLFPFLSSGNMVTLHILEQTFLLSVKVVSIKSLPWNCWVKECVLLLVRPLFSKWKWQTWPDFSLQFLENSCPPSTCPLSSLLRNMKIVLYQFSLDSFDSFEHFYAV